ncbi:MAG TPA: WXG100 family type VII secretion target [Aggregatilineales bacterium]|nr:WXG100 family type VII secretion target [Aggregatilineales bacterium]
MPQFRVDHIELTRLAGTIATHSANVDDVVKTLTGPYEALRGGDWIGVGADKFYNEMEQLIFPGLQLLGQALSDISQHSGQIAKLTQEAESAIISLSKRS